MTAKEVLEELEQYGDENTKKILLKHGAKEPFFGVKVSDLKKILKKTKKNHELSLELFDSGNSDAMYLAGLMADEKKITKAQLNDWADKAYWYYLFEFSVPHVAAETEFGFELGLEWIKSKKENIATAGWACLANYTSIHQDEDLDIDTYSMLLDKVTNELHSAQNRVRYAMNGFVIAIGTYIQELTNKSQKVANTIGKVEVELAGASCKVPLAKDYLLKVIEKDKIGKKRKKIRN